jgi:DNA gyrase subunit A
MAKVGKIQPVEITDQVKKSYLDYAMSVIVARALPDVRDGLKPVHRRILYAMEQMGLSHSSRYTKSAKVVGECLVKNTLVLTKKGLLPIQKINIGDQVYTQNGLNKVIQLYEMPKKPLLKITLENGLSNIATPSQKFKILTPEWKFKWKKAKDLKKNDYIVLRATFPEIIKPVKLIKIEKDQPAYLNENLAYLLGIFVSDGWISKEYGRNKHPRISFTSGNSQIIAKKIVHIFEKEFKYRPTIEARNYPSKKCYIIRINRKTINEFFIANFSLRGQKASTKKIPWKIFCSSPSVIFSFISGLIDGDGYVSSERNLVQYSSVSEILTDQLLILLHHLGIFASKYIQKPPPFHYFNKRKIEGKQKSYSLEIRGENALKLTEKLNLTETNKSKRLLDKKKSKKGNWDKYEIIPYAGKILFQELSNVHLGGGWYSDINGDKFRMGIKYDGGCKIRYSSNLREKPLRKPQIINWRIKDKLRLIGSTHHEFLDHIIQDKIYFLKISSIETTSPEKTYDIGVKNSHEFIANGMISHNCMGKYHPHGDIPIYDALVRLAQDFSMRYPLIDGQGNFGSLDGDSPAAMRYTECRLTLIAQEMLVDIEKDTVEFRDNFDGTLKEPVWLPAKLPNLLLMGSEGIAVGMATKIPPHNLGEIVDALVLMIGKGKVIFPDKTTDFEIKKIDLDQQGNPSLNEISFDSPVTIEKLLEKIKGPDFPTGATIFDKNEIFQSYTSGRGKILMRAVANIGETRGGKFQIFVSEIPYQVNKASLVAQIAHLIKEKKIEGITDLRDESDRKGLRIVLELKKNAKPKAILNNLYKHTPLQTTYPVNMVALVDGTPQTLNLKQILLEFIKHRQKTVTKRTIFELTNARKRAHILEGLKIALDNLEAVIQTIKRSADVETARVNLMRKFSLSEPQASAILEMPLRRLAALERKKIEDEYNEVGKLIEYLNGLLSQPEKILKVIKDELLEIKEIYGDPRRTKVYRQKPGEFSEEDLIPAEPCLITITKTGYIKRLPVGTYRSQRRGGRGVTGMMTKDTDEITQLLTGSTHDNILFFTNKGRVFSIRAWEIAEGSRVWKGQAVINLINIEQGEEIQSVLNLPWKSEDKKYQYLLMVTKNGLVKKTSLGQFSHIRSSGLIAIKLNREDELCWVKPTGGEDHILLVSRKGKSIRFSEKDARPLGRGTVGVKGAKLKKGDWVVGMEVFPSQPQKIKDKRRRTFRDVLIIMENGLGKRTSIEEYRLQKRGGMGIKAAHLTKKTGDIVGCHLVNQEIKQVILTSKKAQVIKLPLKNIPRLGRDTQGVILMRFSKPDDAVAAVTCLEKEK